MSKPKDDLISRSAALEAIDGIKPIYKEQLAMKALCWATVKTIQPVDAVPVEHAVWEERHHAYSDEEAPIEEWQSAKCSKCGKYHTTPYLYYFTDYAYCPNCGARMDGERRDDDADD